MTFQKALKTYDPASHDRNPKLAAEVIARWIDHPDCELIWSKIQPLLPEDWPMTSTGKRPSGILSHSKKKLLMASILSVSTVRLKVLRGNRN